MRHELADVQVGFRKGRRTRNQIANIIWIIKKAIEFQKKKKKKSTSVLFTMLQPLIVWITTNGGKFLKKNENTRPPYPPPEKSVCRSRSDS